MAITRVVLACLIAAAVSSGCTVIDMLRSATNRPASSDGSCKPSVSHGPWAGRHGGGGDLSTGVYIREDDDLVINTQMPIVLRRTYNSGDGFSRHFGMDATHSGEWWIYGKSDPRVPWGDLILPNGARIHFARISPGETRDGAVLRHDTTPSAFNGALLSWTGSFWEMSFCDGSKASFLDCRGKPYPCSIIERRDVDGHRIAYVRDDAGTLLRLESEGQAIAFEYDDHKRISRAFDTLGRQVLYSYDEQGRLVQAEGPEGTIRTYTYDKRSKLTAIHEPGRVIHNWYDEAGRWVRQTAGASDDDEHPYLATASYVVQDGSIVESDFDEGEGLEVHRYNKAGYTESLILGADGPAPVAFVYDLDPVTNARRGVTMLCVGPDGSIKRTLPLSSTLENTTLAALAREGCTPRH